MGQRRLEAMLLMGKATFDLQFGEAQLRRLRTLARLADPLHADNLDDPRVQARLAEVDVLLTSWQAPRLTAVHLARARRLRAVFHCAGTVRGLVSDDLWQRAILVTTAAEENAIPVAEFTLASIIFAGKRAPFLSAELRANRGAGIIDGRHRGLSNRGRTVGIVGFSRIGRRVVEALRATETAAVLVADPHADAQEVTNCGGQLAALPEVLERSEVLSLHAPELPETRHLIGANELALLPDGATVINTARGSLLDAAALERECAAGRLNAILDVVEPDPLPRESILYDLPNVMITPHIAGSLGSETQRMSDRALDELERYVNGLPALAPVTEEQMQVSA